MRNAAPVRIQLSRQRGFNLQATSLAANGLPVVTVARPTPWGNPFTIRALFDLGYTGSEVATHSYVVRCYREWLEQSNCQHWIGPESDAARAAILNGLPTLRGKNLACWCPPDEPCHADVLLEMANS